jgi:hypothetical protein
MPARTATHGLTLRTPEPLSLQVSGKVWSGAEARFSRAGDCHLYVLVAQPAGGLPLLAAQAYGSSHAGAQAAQRKQRALRPGTAVRLFGSGVVACTWSGQRVLRLTGEVYIEIDTPPPFHEAAERLPVGEATELKA